MLVSVDNRLGTFFVGNPFEKLFLYELQLVILQSTSSYVKKLFIMQVSRNINLEILPIVSDGWRIK